VHSIRTLVSTFVIAAIPIVAQVAAAQTATDLVCSQCVSNSDIANAAVGSAKIVDGSIKSEDLAANAVKTTNINASAVTFNKLSPGIRDQLDGSVASISFTKVAAMEEGGTSDVVCPEDKLAISASCDCDDSGVTYNVGVLRSCLVVGDGALASCSIDGFWFNPLLEEPLAYVEAVCIGAVSNDGTPLVLTPAGFAAFNANSPDAGNEAEQTAKWRKEQHDAFEAAKAEQQRERADLNRRIRARYPVYGDRSNIRE